jgi:hypothetical protein
MITDTDLWFVQTKTWSPQWQVHLNNKEGPILAVVTERILNSPTYTAKNAATNEELVTNSRDHLVDQLLTWANKPRLYH